MKKNTEKRSNASPTNKEGLTRNGRKALELILLILGLLSFACFALVVTVESEQTEEKTDRGPVTVTTEYIFADDTGHPIDMQLLTSSWSAEAGFSKRYDLTDDERLEIASVVTAEAEGEPYAGKVAVAQCILQSSEDDGIRPGKVFTKYGYSKARPEPTAEAMAAVSDVFDFGAFATNEPIKYFYAPERCRSDWHESQAYVLTINNHKFFKEASK